MSATDEPAFDWDQAASLLGDNPNSVEEEMAMIVRELVTGADAQFEELKSKNAETQRKEIGALAHGLRGCLLNFGFTAVGTILLEIEKGTCEPNEFPGKIESARVTFIASKKLLAARYPALGLT